MIEVFLTAAPGANRRFHATLIAGVGIVVAVIGLILPAAESHATHVESRLDEFVPVWQFDFAVMPPSGDTTDNHWVYQELRDRKVAMFIDKLDQETTSVPRFPARSSLRAEIQKLWSVFAGGLRRCALQFT